MTSVVSIQRFRLIDLIPFDIQFGLTAALGGANGNDFPILAVTDLVSEWMTEEMSRYISESFLFDRVILYNSQDGNGKHNSQQVQKEWIEDGNSDIEVRSERLEGYALFLTQTSSGESSSQLNDADLHVLQRAVMLDPDRVEDLRQSLQALPSFAATPLVFFKLVLRASQNSGNLPVEGERSPNVGLVTVLALVIACFAVLFLCLTLLVWMRNFHRQQQDESGLIKRTATADTHSQQSNGSYHRSGRQKVMSAQRVPRSTPLEIVCAEGVVGDADSVITDDNMTIRSVRSITRGQQNSFGSFNHSSDRNVDLFISPESVEEGRPRQGVYNLCHILASSSPVTKQGGFTVLGLDKECLGTEHDEKESQENHIVEGDFKFQPDFDTAPVMWRVEEDVVSTTSEEKESICRTTGDSFSDPGVYSHDATAPCATNDDTEQLAETASKDPTSPDETSEETSISENSDDDDGCTSFTILNAEAEDHDLESDKLGSAPVDTTHATTASSPSFDQQESENAPEEEEAIQSSRFAEVIRVDDVETYAV